LRPAFAARFAANEKNNPTDAAGDYSNLALVKNINIFFIDG
jgi:hypothetical protein